MIIDFDHNPNLNTDRKLDSLKESVQMALNEMETNLSKLRSSLLDVKSSLTNVTQRVQPIGTVKYAQLTSNKSVPNNTGTMLTSISLEAGVWVIVCGVRWATNNNGYRRMNLATVSGATDIQYVVHPVQGDWTQAIFTRILEVESTTTYYLNAYQNSGSAINAIGAAGTNYGTYITAVRIK